jgi:hypothetical protein
VPGFLRENKLPAGLVDDKRLNNMLNLELKQQFGEDEISKRIINFQVILNKQVILKNKKLKKDEIVTFIINWLEKQEGVSRVFEISKTGETTLPNSLKKEIELGYYPSRSGDIQIIYKPGYIEGFLTGGTTHGGGYSYDTHIPLLWYGWGIKPGQSTRIISMADIAPTLSALLHIQEPSGSIGDVIFELF